LTRTVSLSVWLVVESRPREQNKRGAEPPAISLKLTVCEMPDDPSEFASEWDRLSRHVRREGSDLVLLPEMPFFYWFCASPKYDPEVWSEAEAEHRRWMKRLHELGAPAVLGSSPVGRGGRRLNEGFVWTKKGGVRAVHYKHYLPDEPGFYEASWYERGSGPFTTFEVGGWKAGLMICSDLWSMANARSYGKRGVSLLAVPRATPVSSIEKWVAGGKVAAVVSGAYCASSNRAGVRGDTRFAGTGWVIDPDGAILGMTSKAKPFVTADIDRSKAEKAKKTYPRASLEPD
jgi:predicted amidohydrolase